ncbi:MAG TPA: 6-phosphofructokinase [Anaerolineaceae bacterium]|nr:6-phosphofructokinase [Anaerolineaceae bacterium]
MKQNIRTIGVMTSGGDAPGMNPAIRAVVRTGLANDMKVVGIVGGYEGMIHGNFRPMGARDVGGILQRGGTILETRRSEFFREQRGQREAIRQLNNAEIDAVVVIGGDGSLNGAQKLAEQGVCVIGIPASIDNDIWGTDMCIGVDTALNTIVDSIDKLRDTASSHNRAFLVEVMGRACGYLGVVAGVVTGAEVVLVPEVEVPVQEVADSIGEAYRRGKTHAIIIVAEGYFIKTNDLAKIIDDMDVGFTTRVTILGHVQRGGKPSAFDRNLATRFGVKAVEFLVQGENNVMTGLDGRDIIPIPISEVVSHHRELNMDYYSMARILAR